jgi:hypothetical protein
VTAAIEAAVCPVGGLEPLAECHRTPERTATGLYGDSTASVSSDCRVEGETLQPLTDAALDALLRLLTQVPMRGVTV